MARQHNPLSAGGWAVATFIAGAALGALLYIPLARLLERADFGLFAEATLVYSGITLAVELSLIRALVRTPGDRDELAQATLWLSVLVGIIGALLCGLSGLPMALIFNEPKLVGLLALLAPAVLAVALGSVPHALLSRELDFRRKMLPETISVGVGAVIAVGAALLGAGVYSLVIYPLCRVTVNTIVAWLVVAWRPTRRAPQWATMRRLLAFGLPASGGELALYARFNVDYAIAGRLLGSDALGVYSLAWSAADRPALFINSFFGNVGYATFARLKQQEQHFAQLRQIYLSATRLIATIALPLFLGATLVRQELVTVVFGSKWAGTIEPLLPLFILQALWVIFYPSVSLVLAFGQSRTYIAINSASLVLTIVAVLIGANYGILGVSWAMLGAVGLTSLVWGALAWRLLRPEPSALWETLKIPFLLAATTLLATALMQWLTAMLGLPGIVRLGAAILTAAFVFSFGAWRCWPTLRQDFNQLREKLPEEIIAAEAAPDLVLKATDEAIESMPSANNLLR